MNKEILTIVDTICQKFHEISGCPTIFLDENDTIINRDWISNITPPYTDDPSAYLSSLFYDREPETKPVIIVSPHQLVYISMDMMYGTDWYGRFIAGPYLFDVPNMKKISALFHSEIDIELLGGYYRSLPVIDQEQANLYAVLCRCALEDLMSTTHLTSRHNEWSDQDDTELETPPYNADKLISECIKNGYPDQLSRFMKDYWENTGLHALLTGTLRDRQNFSIAFASLMCHAAREGGLDTWEVNRTLLSAIHHIESKYTFKELETLEFELAWKLTKKVSELRNNDTSRLVQSVKSFIDAQVRENIKVQDIAERFDTNPKYMSHRFKEETGETVIAYIHQKKVEEAKRMMQTTDMSLAEIAAALSFNDQSHFSKIFKDYSKVTPKQYWRKIRSL